jgi:hypothetical protein
VNIHMGTSIARSTPRRGKGAKSLERGKGDHHPRASIACFHFLTIEALYQQDIAAADCKTLLSAAVRAHARASAGFGFAGRGGGARRSYRLTIVI